MNPQISKSKISCFLISDLCYACQGPDCETLLRDYSKLDIDDFSQGQIDDSVKETADFFGVEPNDGSIRKDGSDGNMEIDSKEFRKFVLDENGNVTMIPVLYCSRGCLVISLILSVCLSVNQTCYTHLNVL